ncbi:MAG: hypothetical protein ACT4N1_07215 [Nitrososphaerota archaeon]
MTEPIYEMAVMNNVTSALNKLPARQEFNEVKSIIDTQNKKVEEILKPIKDEIEKATEARNKKVGYIG